MFRGCGCSSGHSEAVARLMVYGSQRPLSELEAPASGASANRRSGLTSAVPTLSFMPTVVAVSRLR